jgi:CheY-like chemotaxis protein
MHGSMGVESHPGQGTAFWFLIPLEVAAVLPAPPPRAVATTARLRRGRVLIVDDNPVNQLVAQRAVDRFGYVTEVVSGGEQALAAIREAARQRSPFDAVLMDCQMPDMDGYQATAAIRHWEGGKCRVPIIALTANCVEGDREKCLNSGMDDYLAKPFHLASLESTLDRWIVNPASSAPVDAANPPPACPKSPGPPSDRSPTRRPAKRLPS